MTQIVYPIRAKMTTSTTGTGNVTVGSAVDGYQSFADAGVTDGDYIKYTIEDANGNWEVGTGYFGTNATILFRSSSYFVDDSSSGGSLISLSGDAEIYATTSHHEAASRQLLAKGTVSNQSSLTYDWKKGTSGYSSSTAEKNFSKYELLLDRLTPVSDANIYLRVRYGYGGTYNSTSTSSLYAGQYLESQSSTDYANAATSSVHYLSRYGFVGGATNESGWSGTITFMTDRDEYGVTQQQQIHSFGGYINSNGAPVTHQAFLEYGSTTVDIQGFYIYASTGNLDTGKWSLYGVRD